MCALDAAQLPKKIVLADELYELDVACPKNVTAEMHTTAIKDNSSAYSTKEAPRSSVRRSVNLSQTLDTIPRPFP